MISYCKSWQKKFESMAFFVLPDGSFLPMRRAWIRHSCVSQVLTPRMSHEFRWSLKAVTILIDRKTDHRCQMFVFRYLEMTPSQDIDFAAEPEAAERHNSRKSQEKVLTAQSPLRNLVPSLRTAPKSLGTIMSIILFIIHLYNIYTSYY